MSLIDDLLKEVSNPNCDVVSILRKSLIISHKLDLKDTEKYSTRLDRKGKAKFKNSEFGVQNSINQQKVYLEIAEEIKEKYPNIKVVNIENDRDFEETKKELRDFIGY